MSFSSFIARRLGFKTAENKSSSPGVTVGYIGVSLAIAIMLLAIAVVNGFKKEIQSKLVGFNSEITLTAASTNGATNGIRLTDSLRNLILEAAPSATMTLTIRQPGIFKTDSDFQGIILKGIDPKSDLQFYADNLTEGRLPNKEDGANAVIISSLTASRLGLKTGDKVLTHFFDGEKIKSRNLLITGIFDTHFHEFDSSIAFTTMEMLQNLCNVDSLTGTSIELRGVGIETSDMTAQMISSALFEEAIRNTTNPQAYQISTINQSCAQYLNWLSLLDTNVVVIIILMACVASFTLISSLFILILERVNTIGLLKALGATNKQIRHVFIYMTQRLVIRGLLIGNIVAIAFTWLQSKYHIIPLDAEAYYLNYVPVELSWHNILIVNITGIIISVMVLILPSHIIATLSPASTLRYE